MIDLKPVMISFAEDALFVLKSKAFSPLTHPVTEPINAGTLMHINGDVGRSLVDSYVPFVTAVVAVLDAQNAPTVRELAAWPIQVISREGVKLASVRIYLRRLRELSTELGTWRPLDRALGSLVDVPEAVDGSESSLVVAQPRAGAAR